MLWYEDSLYLYAFAFVIVSTVLLRTSLLKSMAFAIVTLATQYPAYLMTDISRPLIYSATAVTIIFVYISRSKYLDDIKYFLAVQQNAQSQKQVIELSIDFNDRIRALLPKEISRRLTYFLSKRGLTVLQAMDEVLQPQQKEICALFSDIRGFTEGTKDLDRYINHGVLPNVRECASAVELNQGIPRKIGDLIFAYFDDPNRYVNLIRSIRAGMEIAKVNQAFNKNNPNGVEIRRHILIASGEAVVGNLGGMDSSIEITALGSPVNFLSRLDELTKTPQLKPHLQNPCLLLCSATASHLEELELGLTLQKLNLRQMGLQIRSFEDVEEVFIMHLNADIERVLEAASKHIQSNYNDTFTTPN